MLRFIHNRSIVKYFLAALGIAFAFYFAWSFYPFGEWVGNHFLQDAPGGTRLLGFISAAILGGCVLIVVFYKEYIKEDTVAYSLATGDTSFMNSAGSVSRIPIPCCVWHGAFEQTTPYDCFFSHNVSSQEPCDHHWYSVIGQFPDLFLLSPASFSFRRRG